MEDEGDRARDFLSALLFVAIGVAATAIAWAWPLGSLHRIGSGALPLGVGVLMIVVGAALGAQAWVRGPAAGPLLPMPSMPDGRALRAVVFVTASLIVFALLIRPMGLFVATASLALVARQAERGATFIGSLVVALALGTVCTLIFVTAIGLPFRIWPAW